MPTPPLSDDEYGLTRSHTTERPARNIRPLGAHKRLGRSKTPTPTDFGPQSLSQRISEFITPSSIESRELPQGQDRRREKSAREVSRSPSSSDRRPWYPFPSGSLSSHYRLKHDFGIAESTSIVDQQSRNANSNRKPNVTRTIEAHIHPSQADSRSDRQTAAKDLSSRQMSSTQQRPTDLRSIDRSDLKDTETHSTKRKSSDESEHTSSSCNSEEKERAHFQNVLKAFDAYLPYSLAVNNRRRKSYYALPRSHRILLSSLGPPLPGPVLDNGGEDTSPRSVGGRGFKARLEEIDDRIRRNADVMSLIVEDSRSFLGEVEDRDHSSDERPPSDQKEDTESQMHPEDSGSRLGEQLSRESSRKRKSLHFSAEHDVDKVRSTIKQMVRDWSLDGKKERDAAYLPILEAFETIFSHVPVSQRGQIRILVPGAGLGRLAFEIAWLGFNCQGNEFSFYMLLTSHFILNKTTQIDEHVVYPFIHSSSNWRTANDMLRPVRIPDAKPSDLPSHVDFSMVAGEFVEVYTKEQEREAWDAVATCFFIDTAHNFTRYLEVINQILPIDGIWINVGPLLWHYEGASHGENSISIELTLEETIDLIELMGFKIESQETLSPQSYTGHPHPMLTYEYFPEFWIARKVHNITPAPAF